MYFELIATTAMGLVGTAIAVFLYYLVRRYPTGTESMRSVWLAIREGSSAYLARQFKTIMSVGVLLAVLLFVALYAGTNNLANASLTSLAFILGALMSLGAAFLSMDASTQSNVRTTYAAKDGPAKALRVAILGGGVLGFSVISMSLLGLSLLFIAFHSAFGGSPDIRTVESALFALAGFAFGASLAALFAQLGGGIYTKSADIGADLVGKIEAGIPEDDPRNPAVIADQVGDNVGDCAGRGADLFESVTAENIGGMIIGLALYAATGNIVFVFFPLLVRAVGIIATIFGVGSSLAIKKFTDAMYPLKIGYVITTVAAVGLFYWLSVTALHSFYLFLAGLVGAIAALLIVLVTGVFTGPESRYVKRIAESSQTGPALTILSGLAAGMESVAFPIVVIFGAILTSFWLGTLSVGEIGLLAAADRLAEFFRLASIEQAPWLVNFLGGVYGTTIATMGMLSVAGMVLTMDGVGPIADNAGGIAEMSNAGEEIRKCLEPLDALGNMTKALTKGYAMASAALAALLLFQAFVQEAFHRFPGQIDFLRFFENLVIVKPQIIAGLLIGGVLPFLFSARALRAVNLAAFRMVEEVRRQFREIPGILEGKAKPDYKRCVDISTKFALKQMLTPSLTIILAPILVGVLLGPEAVGALVIGATITSVPLAIMMMWGGASLDNAKKYIEAGHYGGKRSPAHAAAVAGDTLGDPLKDTAGPSLHIVIKLLNTLSIVFVPIFVGLLLALLL